MDEFALDVSRLRPALLRFARRQVRNAAWAEDAVSETMLAALEKPAAFDRRSRLETWLIGILKFKLVDHMRRQLRETPIAAFEDGEVDESLFDAHGAWRSAPSRWDSPEDACAQRQFLALVDACCDELPPMQARVFRMREGLGLDADEICAELGITPSNLWVLLHRARLKLHAKLQQRWIGGRIAGAM